MKAAVLSCLLLTPSLLGQDGHLEGRVTGSGTKAVPAAVVIVSRLDSGWKRSILTNQRGRFSLGQLPPGEYRLQAVKPQFRLATEEVIEVRSGQSVDVILHMSAQKAPVVEATEEVSISQP